MNTAIEWGLTAAHISWNLFCGLVLFSILATLCGSIFKMLKKCSMHIAQRWNTRRHEQTAQIGALLKELELARSEMAALRAAGAPSAAAPKSGDLRAVKHAFAKRYHPDNIKADGIDKLVRTEIFKEFWSVLEQLEQGRAA